MSELQKALEAFIKEEVTAQINNMGSTLPALIKQCVQDEIRRQFAFLDPNKSMIAESAPKTPIRAQFTVCKTCKQAKPKRWIKNDVCTKCSADKTAPVVQIARREHCQSCNIERHPSNIKNGLCTKCTKAGASPVIELRLPSNFNAPKYYEDLFILFAVSKFSVNDMMELTDLSHEGAVKMLESWKSKNIVKELSCSPNKNTHFWSLTPT